MAINIKSEREIQLMRESCKILAKVHDELGKFIKPGITTADINKYGDELFEFLDTKYPEIPKAIAEEKQISDATDELLNKAIVEFKEQFKYWWFK